MKQSISRILLLACSLGITTKAAPFMAVGDNAELFVTASAQLQFDDNIYLDATGEKNDTIWSLTPGFDLVFGKNSVTKGNLYYKEEIRRYSDNGAQDTELSDVGFKTNYDNGVTKADFNASYAQTAQNDALSNGVGVIVRRKLSNIGAKVEFGLTEKTSLSTGISFAKTNYGTSGYTDSDVWTLPVDAYFKATPKLDWSVGYRYRSNDLAGAGNDNTDHFVNVGARGEFSPKLTGQIRVGVTQRSFDVGADETRLGLEGNLTYLFSEKTSYKFNIGNDFGNSGTGQSHELFSMGLTATSKLSEQWSFTGGLSYRTYDYATRTDDYLEGQVAVTYALNNYVNFGASYTYRNNNSGAPGGDFTNNVFTFGANVRY